MLLVSCVNNSELVKLSDATKNMYAFTKLTDSIFQQIKCSSDSDLEDVMR